MKEEKFIKITPESTEIKGINRVEILTMITCLFEHLLNENIATKEELEECIRIALLTSEQKNDEILKGLQKILNKLGGIE